MYDNWHIPSQKQMVAPYLTIFGLCSRIEKNLVVTYSRSQSCTSRAHVWCHLDHGRWFTVNVTFFQLRFWGKDTQAAEDSVPPKWKRVFVSSTDRATKEFSERIATYSMLNRLCYVQLITMEGLWHTEHLNMWVLDTILTAGERERPSMRLRNWSGFGNVVCVCLCQPSWFLDSGWENRQNRAGCGSAGAKLLWKIWSGVWIEHNRTCFTALILWATLRFFHVLQLVA